MAGDGDRVGRHWSKPSKRLQAADANLSGVEMVVLEIDGSISVVPVGLEAKRMKRPVNHLLQHQR